MIARTTLALLAAAAVALPLAGCGEKPQTAGQPGARKADAKAWEGVQNGVYSASGWKAGDQASWETQLKTRAQQGQNEYTRSAAVASGSQSQ
jgi:hypothetical protein